MKRRGPTEYSSLISFLGGGFKNLEVANCDLFTLKAQIYIIPEDTGKMQPLLYEKSSEKEDWTIKKSSKTLISQQRK